MPDTNRFTRRRLLAGARQLAALTAATGMMPPNLQRLMAQGTGRKGSLKDVKHVVMLMQENRSFDHYFGTLPGVRGFDDPHAMILPHGKSVFHQPDHHHPDGYTLPFHLDSFASNAQKLPSTSHAWSVQHRAWNGGRMDQWLPAHREVDGANGPYTMGYFKRADIPFHFALAEAFTICDAYHCSVMGPTWPNRLYWLTSTIDPEGRAGGPVISNKAPPEGFQWTTYAERLEEAGVPWGVYQYGEHGRPHNMFKYFKRFREAPAGSPLALRGMPEGDEGRFAADVLADRLPAVSWMFPSAEANEHPDHFPAAGADFISHRLNELAANPDVWAKTVFILNYDENDGLFDHVPPPVPPHGTAHEFIEGLPIGGGFRVPCIIVSPWTMGGQVCSEPFDHTSVLQFLERVTGVREPNITPWRRAAFGDLTSAFRFDHAEKQWPILPSTGEMLALANRNAATLPAPTIPQTQQEPMQEGPGRKPSKPA
ncbi:alkaline phosphatase family protein [Novosphingobium sp.]|uniref:alkaline phosphatase family protein n=1 Tax=Novosphingobium sp. TaxID=1874826 RepID=UPI0031D61CFD